MARHLRKDLKEIGAFLEGVKREAAAD